jgi:hypothetical protein
MNTLASDWTRPPSADRRFVRVQSAVAAGHRRYADRTIDRKPNEIRVYIMSRRRRSATDGDSAAIQLYAAAAAAAAGAGAAATTVRRLLSK